MRTTRLAAVMLTALLGLGALTACDPDLLDTSPLGSQPPAAVPADLDALTVADWASMSGYSRDRFPHWASQGHSCDTRDVVLQRDGTDVVTGEGCAITGGTWVSAYDGVTVTDKSKVQIDHTVPLANAWRTGAATWTDEERAAFANDLTRPQLLAVSAHSNESKGDKDPSVWRPDLESYWCTYAQDWVTVKAYWNLSVTADEKAALAEMLATCA